MLVYAVDLGTTNTKVVLYDEALRRLAVAQAPARLDRDGAAVEFDADALVDTLVALVHRCAASAAAAGAPTDQDAVIALTGQAESLVLLGTDGRPVVPSMSWLDERAVDAAVELGALFGVDAAFAVTGQPFPSATWPAAKLRRLHRQRPEVLAATADVLLVKDHVVGRLTGRPVGEETTRGFSYLWDVAHRGYWTEMTDVCGVRAAQLPEVVPAGTDAGPVTAAVAERLPTARSWRVNVGALDHFCAMVGTGSYRPGVVSESAGTVLSLSVLADDDWAFDPGRRVSFHHGIGEDDVVLFNGVDSGGVALEWFRRELLAGMPYDELEERLSDRPDRSAPVFLPYLTGVAPPDYFTGARGAFLGLDLGHDRIDLAHAVEEGIAHLLRRNVDALGAGAVREIVSSGGGAASTVWSQLKADVCGVDVVVPGEQEATCRGAAVLALVAAGARSSIHDADEHRPETVRHVARQDDTRRERYARFEDGIDRLFRA